MHDTAARRTGDDTGLTALLRRFRRRWLVLVTLSVGARAILGITLVACVVIALDRAGMLGDTAVLAVAGAAALTALGIIVAVAWPFRTSPDDRRVARFIEERCPELEDTLVTAVDLGRDPHQAHHAFAPLVSDEATSRLSRVETARVVSRDALLVRGRRLGLAVVAFALAAVLAAPFARRATETARLRFFPESIEIAVAPGNVRIPAGRPLRIVARLGARAGALTRVAPQLALESAGRAGTMPMVRAADGFEVRINAVDRSFRYAVRAGSASSPVYDVTAIVPPHVQRIDLHYDYPPFTRLTPRDETDGGDIYAPAGTRVRVRVRTDKPVTSARLAMAEGAPAVPLVRVDDRTVESTLVLNEEGAYRVALADADGLSSDGIEYFIRLVDDRPADVHILHPNGDQQITPLEEVTIEARADDDFGVASMDMVYTVAGGPEKVVPFTSLSGTALARVGSRLVAAEDLGVKPGDVISYYARARDVAHGKQSTLSRSGIFFLEVKPFNEEYVLAQSQAMAAAAGTQIESLVAAQKEIISATWNLERRSSAGRSSADVKAVADAQSELKGRTEQAAGVLRPRGRGRDVPQDQARPSAQRAPGGADPVADAVAAMSRALQQLETRQTADAIPHEMSALNALLRAQAEVRRRQVTQQSNGSSNAGNGRQGQDLSNLFDRELKRQQRTNYENRAQVEQQMESKTDNALDRIRDLATRQEDLTRQQRDLANAGLSAEELKRRLETLQREQQELQQQLEGQMREGSASSSSTGSVGSGSQGSSEMNRALEEMRRASAELQRNDPNSAAARSQQAAAQLRDLQARMEGRTPDARTRALGDVQLESQQLAAAERRLANEATRLAGDPNASDARRRLAGEQDQLADRAAALEDATKRLGRDRQGDAAARNAAAAAARELESQRIGDRMREAAKALRGGAKAGDAAASTRQLADAMDQVARRANGADAGGAKGDTERLADQLGQIRDARDRLSRLEQQLKNAERRAGEGARAGRSGAEGQRGQNGARGEGQGGDLAKLQQEYAREVQRTRDMLQRLGPDTPDAGRGMSTPEDHEWSRSAPGTEAWKQDYAAWTSLAADMRRSLERSESSLADRLATARASDRLRAGGSDRVPDVYRDRVARYFELLATKKAGGGT